jgi:hypothetical protein
MRLSGCGRSSLDSQKSIECRAISSKGIFGTHSSQPGSASPRIWAPCEVAHIWINPSGYGQSSAPK